MENDIWAIFKHIIRDNSQSLDEQHSLCPRDSWCTYWSNREKYNDQKRLASVFIEVLKPLFLNLTKSKLLKRCLQGLTQNQNEAINGLSWGKCPKTKFCGKVKVLLAVSETISHFNTGSGSKVTLLNQLNIESSKNMLSAVRKEDHKRIIIAAKIISEKSQMHRRKLCAKKLRKNVNVIAVTYQACSFGLSEKPEDITKTCSKKKAEKLAKNDAEPVAPVFIDESQISLLMTKK